MDRDEDPNPNDLSLPPILDYIGFQLISCSPKGVQGTFVVSERTCQVHGVLHGGVSALLAENLGSVGASAAAGCRPIAGVQLSINHLSAAPLGTQVHVKATPVHVGRTLQLWEIIFTATKDSTDHSRDKTAAESETAESKLIAVAKLTTSMVSRPKVNFPDMQRFFSKI